MNIGCHGHDEGNTTPSVATAVIATSPKDVTFSTGKPPDNAINGAGTRSKCHYAMMPQGAMFGTGKLGIRYDRMSEN